MLLSCYLLSLVLALATLEPLNITEQKILIAAVEYAEILQNIHSGIKRPLDYQLQ